MSGVQATVSPPRVPLALAASCLGMLALGVNGTAIMAALPTMRHDLGLTPAQVEWAINAYLVVSAACIIPGGRACDQFGARRVSIVGLALFAAASLIVATGQGPAAILAGRALQGLAAALAVPGTLATVSEASSLERRASAISAWAGFVMLGFSLGPLIGGTLTHYLDWRTIFWASGGSMLVAAAGLASRGQAMKSNIRPARRFDAAGFALLAIGMVAVVSALHALPTMASAPERSLGLAGAAVVAFAMLARHERRLKDPLVDLDLLGRATFVRAIALSSIAMSCILALLLFYNLYVQGPEGLGLTPVGAGLSLLPMSGGLLIFAFAAPGLVKRLGARRTLTGSTLLIAIAGIVIAAAATLQLWIPLIIGLFAIGVGLAVPYATASKLALAALPGSHAGAGSGIINASTFLGGSIGVAAGAVAFTFGGLPATMAMIVVLALVGAALCRGLATEL
jgi:MFS family permease